MNIYQIIIKEETDYTAQINAVKDEIASLSARRSEPAEMIRTEESGYFISGVDGFEEMLTTESLKSMTAEDIKKITEGGETGFIPYGAAGKMVSGYEWKMAGLVDSSLIRLKTGDKINMRISSTPDTVNVTVDEIRPGDKDESILILSCNKLTYNLVQRRVERVELIINDFEGLRVSRGAIRFGENNEKGVYVLMGQKVSFKKLDVIYETDDYVLSRNIKEQGCLSLYDDIIIRGEISPADIDGSFKPSAEEADGGLEEDAA